MNHTQHAPRLGFSTLERSIVGAHAVTAVAFGIYGFVDVSDPGWAGLQRILVLMLTGLWVGGIALSALLARITNRRWLRIVILLAGPLAGIALLIAQSNLGLL